MTTMGYVYKTTNIKNGKVYIGQSKKCIQKSSRYIGSGKFFLRAVKEFGRDCFVKEIIEEIDSNNCSLLDEREKYWIFYYDSTNPDNGYNLTKGGAGWSSFGMKRSDETREKQSKKRLGKEPWNKGLTGMYSDEQKQKMIDNRKIKSGFKQRPKFIWSCPKGDFYKRKEVADIYGVSTTTISLWVNDNMNDNFSKQKIKND